VFTATSCVEALRRPLESAIKGDSYRLREKRRSGLLKPSPVPVPAGASV
jgi:hypothetical protein